MNIVIIVIWYQQILVVDKDYIYIISIEYVDFMYAMYLMFAAKGTLSEDTIASFLKQIGRSRERGVSLSGRVIHPSAGRMCVTQDIYFYY